MPKKPKPDGSAVLLLLIVLAVSLSVWQSVSSSLHSAFNHQMQVSKPTTYDFPELSEICDKYIHQDRIDYGGLRASGAADRAMLKLGAMSDVDLAAPNDKLAYWINAHNLVVLKILADRYPDKAIASLGPVFAVRKFRIGGKHYSLNELDQLKLYPLIKTTTPKALFLVANGSVGGPTMPERFVKGQNLPELFEKATREYVSSPANFYFDPANKSFVLSPYFEWNSDILKKGHDSLEDFLGSYVPQKYANRFANPVSLKRYNLPYDWRENDISIER